MERPRLAVLEACGPAERGPGRVRDGETGGLSSVVTITNKQQSKRLGKHLTVTKTRGLSFSLRRWLEMEDLDGDHILHSAAVLQKKMCDFGSSDSTPKASGVILLFLCV